MSLRAFWRWLARPDTCHRLLAAYLNAAIDQAVAKVAGVGQSPATKTIIYPGVAVRAK